ncbi:N-acetylmuramoyl-L-alanine amidase family protein [Maribacter hydrothermalis]|uniref:N-acetylmuramoyl-L-alanine amidase n=1 Tax=Maribacter hydrothermalis TaxID=1836467 RepID=A0A1B7ZD77_9FLAO|nr:N-acetylmuramoyl-L-alanine amidase [Maribacter hydrothermalis]APQ18486.1 N-acetylmuramoyl-L-alanine amidase [Maribacter hydrothermalis]OBR41307.1 N-acetylmuramoyl-L-alanine amidase [Maribacter hydrothermalis]
MKIKFRYFSLVLTSSLLLLSFSVPVEENNINDPFVVVLDAGHGGHDPGNLGNGYLEKKIALNIVLKVGEILSAHKDIKVIYTRKDDTFIDLYVRGEVANKANADLFVSVHCDSHTSDAHGAGTFVLGLHANKQNFEIAKKENSVIYLEDNYENRYADYDINSPESVIGLTIMQEEFLDQSVALATMIQDNFSNSLKRTDRKVKQAGFIVLHQTFMPSVLVETGFLTNKEEGAYLNSSKGQNDMGNAIAKAILHYKEGVQPSVNSVANNVEKPKNQPDNKEIINKVEEKKNDASEIVTVVKKQEPVSDIMVKEEVKLTVIDDKIKEAINPKEVANSIVFKIQIMATSKNLSLNPGNFKGLSNLSQEPFKNLYRYMYGETRSYREAEMMQSLARDKGYATAYIVAYKLGERIPIKDAMDEVSEFTP